MSLDKKLEILNKLKNELGLQGTHSISKRRNAETYPLSYAQERMWFTSQISPDSAAYNIPLAMKIVGKIDENRLRNAFNGVVRKHEVLRANFFTENGSPVQQISPFEPVNIRVIPVMADSLGDQEGQLKNLVNEQAGTPISLESDFLFNINLYKLSEEDHVLLIVLHHIIFDGWSTGVLMKEIFDMYNNDVNEELQIQYADYAQWQIDKFENGKYEKHLEYWKNKLESPSQNLQLPYDNKRDRSQAFKGDIQRFVLNKRIVSDLKSMSKKERVSPFSILLSAYYLFLYKYTNQKDITLGIPIANRQYIEIESLIGCVANTIPLKVEIDTMKSLNNFIKEVNTTAQEAQDFQELPFDKLVDELRVDRSLDSNPIFQSMFVFLHQHSPDVELDGCTFTPYEVETKTSKLDLSLSIMEKSDTIEGFFEYSKRFNPESINRMLRNYIHTLQELLYEPTKLIANFGGVSVEEEELILNVTRKPSHYKTETIHERFEQQVQKYPDSIALVQDNNEITYRELDEKANQLARYLNKQGVRPETLVAVTMDKSIEFIVSILAVLKAGGTYIPLDPEQPVNRREYIIEDSHCEFLITEEKYINHIGTKSQTITFKYEDEEWKKESTQPLNIEVLPSQIAYIIYTSGSTGKPKGVLNTHHNVGRLFSSADTKFRFSEKDSWTLFHSTAFDFSVWEIWGALFYGGKLFIVSPDLRRKPDAFYHLLSDKEITVLNQTPSAFKELMNTFGTKAYPLALKYIVFGGEALDFHDLKQWYETYGNQTKLVNMYGITETTVHVTWKEIQMESIGKSNNSLIGKPLDDLNIFLLSDELNPTPIGVPGEIYVSGDGLARGYNERFALTAERFIPNPFSGKGDRLYKTGDIGKYTSTMDVEYIGRIDDQVKVKGHRIELGELRSVIAHYSMIRDCIVINKTNERKENELVAFVVFTEENESNLKSLRRALLSDIPKYMYPSHIIPIKGIPVTSNGKVDKVSLLKLCEDTGPSIQKLPASQIEKDLIAIWKSVLNKEVINVSDNFFSLGGDSIRSLKIISGAEEKGYVFTLEELFQHQTIGELSQLIEQKVYQEEQSNSLAPFSLLSDDESSIMDECIEDAYPLTKSQEGMFFHMEQYPNEPLYHNIDSVLLKGKLDIKLFRKAVQFIVSENVMLRTSFDLKSFKFPMQLVHKKAVLEVGYSDIRTLSLEDQDEVIDEFVKKEKRNSFNLTKPSLLRFHLHQRSDETFQFTLTECHLIFDGWSLTSTLAEIFQVYFELLDGKPRKENKSLSIDFNDFVHLEQQAIKSIEHTNFWKDFLENCQSLQLPIYPEKKTTKQEFKVRRRIVELTSETSQKLKKVSEMYSVPVKSTLLASHIKALQVISGQSDIVTGMVSNGRMEKKDGEKVKGLFINTLPFRQKVSSCNWIELMKATFEIEQNIMPFRRLPLPEIQRHVNRSTLFETAFNYVYFHSMEPLLKSKKVEFLGFNSLSANDTHFKLMVTFSNHPPDYEIRLTLAYDESTFTEEQMDDIADIYRNILNEIAKDPLTCHDDQTLLPDHLYKEIIQTWNDTHETYSDESLLLHELIEKQAQESPDKIAIIANQKELTYAALNEEANKVARFLSQKQNANDYVGIYMDRSVEMVIGIIGILKAGYAYLPLDTSYPLERVRFMIEDSKTSCVLTSREQEYVLKDIVEHCYRIESVLTMNINASENDNGGNSHLAYMIYTSGSTGRPKGVMVPHSGVVNRILWMNEHYESIPSERVLHKTPLSFDYSVFEIFSTLCTGNTLVVAKAGGHKDSHYLASMIKEHNITTLYFVPTMLQELLNVEGIESCISIKRVMCSGEPLPELTKERFFELFQAELYNQYGPTEASVEVTSFKCEKSEHDVRIGKPMANTQLYILNDDLHPVGVAVTGELYIGGLGLATAYFNNPRLSAEKFIPNLFSSNKGDRLYKTGDLAKYTPTGEIEYVGRIDNQIKHRGIRIELGEIESSIRNHPLFKDATVLYKKDTNFPLGYLVGYVIPGENNHLTEMKVKSVLKDRLPRYMIPDRIIMMDKFPVNPNGKLDRKAFPDPIFDRTSFQHEYCPPVTPLEMAMADVYQEILGVEKIGIHDDFFELGGNSLTSVHLMNHIEKILGQKVPLETIYENPSISRLLDKVIKKNTWLGRMESFQTNQNPELFTEITSEGWPIFFIPKVEAVFASTMVPNGINIGHVLGKEHRFIGIQPPTLLSVVEGIDFNSPLDLDLEEVTSRINENDVTTLVKTIVQGIKCIQPEGPFLIGTEVNGGEMLALEIVKMLESQGEEVKQLIIVNPLSAASEDISLPLTPRSISLNYMDDVNRFVQDLFRNWGVSVPIEEMNIMLSEYSGEDLWQKITSILKVKQEINQNITSHNVYNLFVLHQLNLKTLEKLNGMLSTWSTKIKADVVCHSATANGQYLLDWSQLTEGNVLSESWPPATKVNKSDLNLEKVNNRYTGIVPEVR